MSQPIAAPPGWYPDPHGQHHVRWFDGVQWTSFTAPTTVPGPPAGAHPDSVTHWLVPTGRSWQSIAAGYVGLCAIVVVFLGPVAIGLGVWGLAVAGKQGSHGRGRCVFGIVTGLWGSIITLAFLLQA